MNTDTTPTNDLTNDLTNDPTYVLFNTIIQEFLYDMTVTYDNNGNSWAEDDVTWDKDKWLVFSPTMLGDTYKNIYGSRGASIRKSVDWTDWENVIVVQLNGDVVDFTTTIPLGDCGEFTIRNPPFSRYTKEVFPNE